MALLPWQPQLLPVQHGWQRHQLRHLDSSLCHSLCGVLPAAVHAVQQSATLPAAVAAASCCRCLLLHVTQSSVDLQQGPCLQHQRCPVRCCLLLCCVLALYLLMSAGLIAGSWHALRLPAQVQTACSSLECLQGCCLMALLPMVQLLLVQHLLLAMACSRLAVLVLMQHGLVCAAALLLGATAARLRPHKAQWAASSTAAAAAACSLRFLAVPHPAPAHAPPTAPHHLALPPLLAAGHPQAAMPGCSCSWQRQLPRSCCRRACDPCGRSVAESAALQPPALLPRQCSGCCSPARQVHSLRTAPV